MSSPLPALVNVTIDDFDPLVAYSDYAQWTTPDPSVNPTWFNASRDVTGSVWHQATYHLTTTPSARATFNITSSSLWIYGAANGTYTITIDPRLPRPFNTSFTPPVGGNGTDPSAGAERRALLFGSSSLRWDTHEVVIENNNGGLLVDLVIFEAAVGAINSPTRNITIEDTSPAVRYTGNWTTQNGPTFSNGTSTYTRGGGNSFAIDFEGSALYLYGDQVNDHGFYEVYVDQGDRPWEARGSLRPNATLNDRSGCGGGWAKACEKLSGLKYHVAGLSQGQHTVAVRNLGIGSYPGEPTFFDFDRAIVTVPDTYAVPRVDTGECPFYNCDLVNRPSFGGGASSAAGASGAPSPTGSGAAASQSSRSAAHTRTQVGMGGAMGSGWAGTAALGLVLCKLFAWA